MPEAINSRIGNELDSIEGGYFGLFSWVKGFKNARITSENNELTFRISRNLSGDTVFTFSQKNSEYLDDYIKHYEEIFVKPEIQKSIDLTEISPYLRPSNPLREVGEISVELLDKTFLKRQLIWMTDSVIVVWKDDSAVELGKLEKKIDIIPFYDVAYINNQAILGNHQAYVNNAAKVRNQSWFVKASPELHNFLKANSNNNSGNRSGLNEKDQVPKYSDVQEEYLKKFTLSVLYKFNMYIDPNKVFVAAFMYSELVTAKQNWAGELLYNINPMFSIGAEYGEIPYLEYPRKSRTFEPISRDVVYGNEATFLCRIRPKPRDPINDSFESEIGLGIGRGNYTVSLEQFNLGGLIAKAEKKASPWIFSLQLGYSYFFTNFVSAYGGILFRSSTPFEIPDANDFKNTRSVNFTLATSFLGLRIHPW
ncbi:MAG: hypothetical protein V4642_11570 [Bacteroidota bacterium]